MIGRLYNTVVSIITGFVSLAVYSFLKKKREKEGVSYSQGLDYFCLLLGLLWLFVGVRTFFVYLGYIEVDYFIFKWISGPLTYIHLIPLFYYFGWSFFRKEKKKQNLFNGIFSAVVLATLGAFFKFGFTLGESTYWGTDYTPNPLTNKLFTYGLFLPVFVCMIIDFIRRLKGWAEDREKKQLLGFSLGFILYAMVGIFDALGIAEGWMILLFRVGVMLAPLVFYLSVLLAPER